MASNGSGCAPEFVRRGAGADPRRGRRVGVLTLQLVAGRQANQRAIPAGGRWTLSPRRDVGSLRSQVRPRSAVGDVRAVHGYGARSSPSGLTLRGMRPHCPAGQLGQRNEILLHRPSRIQRFPVQAPPRPAFSSTSLPAPIGLPQCAHRQPGTFKEQLQKCRCAQQSA